MMSELTNLGLQGKKLLKDQVTPYKVAILVFIEEYCKVTAKPRFELQPQEIMSSKEERDFMIALLQLVQSADMELKDFMQTLGDVAKSPLLDAITDKLRCLAEDGVRTLMDLFQSLPENLFQEPNALLHKSSILGLFVRRMLLAFDRLSFSQATKLHTKYRLFYETWSKLQQKEREMLDSSNYGDASLSIMEIMGDAEDDQEDDDHHKPNLKTSVLDAGRYSQRQAEFFIAQQCTLLQHNELEGLSPRHLQQKISELLNSNPELAEAHYLSYLNNLRVKEYVSAMESLCHYFDRQQFRGDGGMPSPPGGSRSKQEEDLLSRSVRYAALNLAALHSRFGHRNESLAAVREAIRMAQDSSDHVCLQHALGWLQRLGVQGTGNTAYLLDRLVTKAEDLNLPYLTSLGVQAFARHNALASAQPASVFEFLLKSDIYNCQQSQLDLMCVSYAQKAALWHMYGRREMSSLCCQLMLHLNTADMGVYHNGEPECIGLVYLARQHAEQGDYETATEILATAKRRFPMSSQHASVWMLYEQQLLFTRAVHHGKWVAAEKAVLNMAAVSSLEASYCRCVLLKEKGEASKAFELVKGLVEQCREKREEQDSVQDTIQELYTRLLLLQGELYCVTGNAPLAGQSLLTCLTLARRHHFSYMVATATVHLAYVQFCLGMPSQALTLIEEVLTIILSHGSMYDRARSLLLCTKCHVSAASRQGATAKQQALLSGLQTLGDVVSWFKQVQAHHRTKDALYYQARLYHELGYMTERNQCAREFKLLDQQYPSSHVTRVLVL